MLLVGAGLTGLIFRLAEVRHLAYFGQDFAVSYFAGRAFLHHQDVYTTHAHLLPYLYPPPAALVWTPFNAFDLTTAKNIMLVFAVILLVCMAHSSARLSSRCGSSPGFASGVALLGVALWQPTFEALSNENATLLLAPVVPLFLLLSLSGHHYRAASLLGLSLAIKPLLLPLLVVPMLMRAPKACAVAVAIPIFAIAAVLPFTAHSLRFFSTILPRLLSGDAGRLGQNNMSLANLGELGGLSAPLVLVARLVVGGLAIAVATVAWRSKDASVPLRMVECTGALFAGWLSVGGTNESHYQLILVPLFLTVVIPASALNSFLGGVSLLLVGWSGPVIYLSSNELASRSLWRAIGVSMVLLAMGVSQFRQARARSLCVARRLGLRKVSDAAP